MPDQTDDFEKTLEEQRSNLLTIKERLIGLEEKLLSMLNLYRMVIVLAGVVLIAVVLFLIFILL